MDSGYWEPRHRLHEIGPGCKHCYANAWQNDFRRWGSRIMPMAWLSSPGPFLELPLTWKKARTIFVNSMSDLFHKAVPVDFVFRVFDVMRRANWHQYQLLTKRSSRLLELNPRLSWLPNVWMGVSVETRAVTFTVDHLRQTNAHTKFLSVEPLLGPLFRPRFGGN